MHVCEYKIEGKPRVWLVHNGDWSGDVTIRWQLEVRESIAFTKGYDGELTIPAAQLLRGDGFESTIAPRWVVARAVASAVRADITSRIIRAAEDMT